jgi:hypothetical protein
MFVNGIDDRMKARIFMHNRRQWEELREDIRLWCLEGWDEWQADSPEWFEDMLRVGIDEDMVPEGWEGVATSAGIGRFLSSGRQSGAGGAGGLRRQITALLVEGSGGSGGRVAPGAEDAYRTR